MASGQIAGSSMSIAALAQLKGVRECLQWFTREKSWINEQHVQLCRIPAPTFLEGRRAEWMAQQLRALGCQAEIDRAGNVVAFPEPDRGEPLVALTAHLDTVLAPRKPEEITVEPDGTIRGPGVADNGAGLAALLAVARAMRANPLPNGNKVRLALVANVAEEGEGNLNGMRHLANASPLAPRIRSYIVLDGPAMDQITCQALASRRFEVTYTGPGGHSWTDHGTANPIHALGAAIALFAGQCPNGASGMPRSSYNFGIVEGGSSINSIPVYARAKVDLRSEREERIAELADTLAGAVERALEIENARASGGKVTAKIREIGSRPGGRLRPDAPVLAALRSVDAHLGIRARLDCASTDANVPLSLGLDALSIGAGGQGGGAHTPSEWYHPEGRDLGLKRIFLTLALLMWESWQG